MPLSAATTHILLALAGGELHGYGIKLEIARQSGGRYRPGPGTLYDNIDRLTNDGLIEEVKRRAAGDDPRRRYYRITPDGRRLLAVEVERLDSVVRLAKRQLARGSAA